MARVLALLHLPTSNTGLVGAHLEAAGHQLTLCRPQHGDALPPTADFAATVIFGGPQHANEPRFQAERRWIEHALAHRHPLMGICLGAQLMALALDGQVQADPQGRVEVGYAPITPADAPTWLDRPRQVYHWHRDGFTLPPGATLMARGGEAFPVQAFAYGRSLAFQFHPEVTTPIMEHWLARDHGDLHLPGARPAAAHREAHVHHASANSTWLQGVLQRWVPPDSLD